MALYKKKQSYFFLIANLLERACNVVIRHLFRSILLGFSKRHQLACTLGNCARQRVGAAILVRDFHLSFTTVSDTITITIIPLALLPTPPFKLLKILCEKQIDYCSAIKNLRLSRRSNIVFNPAALCTRHTHINQQHHWTNAITFCIVNNNLELIILLHKKHTYRHMYIELSTIV